MLDKHFPNCLRRTQEQDSFIDVSDFGASGYGDRDDSRAIQAAIDYAHITNRDVYIPKTHKSYDLYNVLVLRKGVRLYSDGAKINRKFARNVSGWAIFLEGNNEVSGIDYDGGSENIPLDFGSHEFIYYADFVTDRSEDRPNRFINNTFNNSCGSFILGNSENVLVKNNTFKDYYDHAVYFGGRNYEGKISKNISIIENTFKTTNVSTREAVKVRNGIDSFVLANNIVDLPKAAFSTFDVGDSSVTYQSNKNITISGNIGYCSRFALFNGGINNS
ncbi:glycosyl hydrolase family 28-related protein, partial [Paenibacillus lautus]|uniref:glycosyl hydrolase family 28-related protein n=1 Tax=Paenibacillus lautus TaxID=1401 RepID=UPI001C7E1465